MSTAGKLLASISSSSSSSSSSAAASSSSNSTSSLSSGMSGVDTKFFKCADRQCLDDYKLGRTLGQGAFATVRIATESTTGLKWAVKVIKRSALLAEDEDSLQNEIYILRNVAHTGVFVLHFIV